LKGGKKRKNRKKDKTNNFLRINTGVIVGRKVEKKGKKDQARGKLRERGPCRKKKSEEGHLFQREIRQHYPQVKRKGETMSAEPSLSNRKKKRPEEGRGRGGNLEIIYGKTIYELIVEGEKNSGGRKKVIRLKESTEYQIRRNGMGGRNHLTQEKDFFLVKQSGIDKSRCSDMPSNDKEGKKVIEKKIKKQRLYLGNS